MLGDHGPRCRPLPARSLGNGAGAILPAVRPALLVLVLCGACNPSPTTQAILLFEAEAPLDEEAARLTIEVRGEDTLETRDLDLRSEDPLERLPIEFPIVPVGGDASREYDVLARLYDDDGDLIGEQRAHGAYVKDELVRLRVLFSPFCRDIVCPEARTCVDGYCRSDCHGVSAGSVSGPASCDQACELTESGPIVAQAGQTYERLRIVAPVGEVAIRVDGADDVVLRDIEIVHDGAHAIEITDSDRVRLEGIAIEHGEGPTTDVPAVRCVGSSDSILERLRVRRSAAAVFATNCDGLRLSRVAAAEPVAEGDTVAAAVLEMRGGSDLAIEDFSVVTSDEEAQAAIRLYVVGVDGATVRRGLAISTNRNDASNIKMLDSDAIAFEDIDIRRAGHIGFEGYPATNVTLTRTSCAEPLDSNFIGEPTNPFCWYFGNGSSGVTVTDSRHDWPEAPVQGGDGIVSVEAEAVDGLESKPPLALDFCFE